MANFYRLDPERQRELSFQRLLKYLREIVAPYHPAFRSVCREAQIDPLRIRTYEDFRRIPLTTKKDIRRDPTTYILQPIMPGKAPLHPTSPIGKRFLAAYLWRALTNRPRVHAHLFRRQSLREKVEQRLCREWLPIHFHASSGSTGDPTPAAYTHRDFTRLVPELASGWLLRPDDPDPEMPYARWDNRGMNLMPGAPHLAFFQVVLGKLAVGGSFFDTFGGRVVPTDRQIEIFARGGFNSLAAVPSYVVYWLRRAVEMLEEGRIGPFGETFRGIAVGAEPITDPMRRRIHELAARLEAHPRFQVIETYGMTEMKWAGGECREGSGIHLSPKFFFWEILHPETREPVGPGEPGVLVFSHIDWRGTVFVRYWTGDLVQGGLVHDRCTRCGYTFVRIYSPIMRAEKDFTKIKGTLVPLQLLVSTIRDTAGVRNCQVVLEKEEGGDEFSRDRMTVRLLPEAGADVEAVSEAIRANVRAALEITPDRIVVETDEQAFEAELFARTGIKADYVVEKRAVHI